MKQLIGRRIEGVAIASRGVDENGWFNEGEDRLVFTTDGGMLAYETDADCCSKTWFADIIGVHALIGGLVRSVEDIELPQIDDHPEHDCLQSYGIKITTDRGVADIVYRNASNGYYGGWCSLSTDTSLDGAVEITEDWTA